MSIPRLSSVFFPTHDIYEKNLVLDAYRVSAVRIVKDNVGLFLRENPSQTFEALGHVRSYFGEEVGLYFAWMSNYISWLLVAWPFGLIVFVHMVFQFLQIGELKSTVLTPIYSVFISIWATLLTEYWMRKERTLAVEWDMHGYEQKQGTRAEFVGDEDVSAITGLVEKWFEPFRRTRITRVSRLVVGTLIFICASTVFFIKYIKDISRAAREVCATTPDDCELGSTTPAIEGVEVKSSDLAYFGIQLAAGIANALFINILNFVYQRLARYYNDLENWRTDTEYQDNLIMKTFVFQFVNSNLAVLWAAFGQKDPQNTFVNVAAVMVTKQAIDVFKEIRIPRYRVERARRRFLKSVNSLSQEGERKGSDSAVERQKHDSVPLFEGSIRDGDAPATLPTELLGEWEALRIPWDGLTDDYAEMVIQFGHVVMFASAFPLGPLFAFVNNVFEIKSEAFKYTRHAQRPRSHGAADIGAWSGIMEFIALFGVVTNCALIFQSENGIGEMLGFQGADARAQARDDFFEQCNPWRVLISLEENSTLLNIENVNDEASPVSLAAVQQFLSNSGFGASEWVAGNATLLWCSGRDVGLFCRNATLLRSGAVYRDVFDDCLATEAYFFRDLLTRVVVLIVLEHMLIGVKLLVMWVIDDEPYWITERLQKEEYIEEAKAEMAEELAVQIGRKHAAAAAAAKTISSDGMNGGLTFGRGNEIAVNDELSVENLEEYDDENIDSDVSSALVEDSSDEFL